MSFGREVSSKPCNLFVAHAISLWIRIGLSPHLVPLVEGLHKLVIGQATNGLQHVVCLTDQLHVTVLDAVVHHLDKVAGAT